MFLTLADQMLSKGIQAEHGDQGFMLFLPPTLIFKALQGLGWVYIE